MKDVVLFSFTHGSVINRRASIKNINSVITNDSGSYENRILALPMHTENTLMLSFADFTFFKTIPWIGLIYRPALACSQKGRTTDLH